MATFFGKLQKPAESLPEPAAQAEMLTGRAQQPIGAEEIAKASELLTKYQQGKSNLEDRIVNDELWWELRHWESIRKGTNTDSPEPTSAWLFNSVVAKHADAMDNYPEPAVLPRERADEESAKTLSSVLPVVMEYNDFEETYSSNWWEKLKHGTAAYGVFWNSEKENGLGDIDIKQIDLLKIFWEPGVTNIQDSRNLFICELIDTDLLEQMYPDKKGKLAGSTITVKEYQYDDNIDNSEKSVVVDWYYKVKAPNGKTILHYAKFVGSELLYASENMPEFQQTGFYNHGMYPIVFDCLFPEKGTPVGFGLIAVCKDPQLYIDKLSANIMQSAMMDTKKRYFISNSTAVNEDEFLDWSRPMVHVEGEISESRIQPILTTPISPIYFNVLQSKIEEMKETSSNRDVSNGSSGAGITAASAIAALQEAGNKSSRDMISASYRAYSQMCELCIELMRQFYDETRSFRITGTMPGQLEFIDMNNRAIAEQAMGIDSEGNPLYRVPIFDLKIKAMKRNPFSRMEENERAKELYQLGFFNPDRAQESLGALEMMSFEGIDKVKEYVGNGQTLMNVIQQMQAQNQQMAAIIQQLTGRNLGAASPEMEQPAPERIPKQMGVTGEPETDNNSETHQIMKSRAPMTDYGQRLAKRSKPDMSIEQ